MDRHKQRAAATRRTPWVVAGPFVAGPFVSGPFVAGLAICPATALAQADPQPTPAAIVDQVAQRDRAEALVQRLLETEDPDSQTELETELATLGESAAVALRLATLTGDFQQRQWADAAASRLRWRQAAGPDLLSRHDDLVATMARGNPQQRGALVDILAAAEDPQALGFFIECLTDDQPYVQRRAVDALVAIAEQARRLSSVSLDPSNAPTGASPTDARSAIVAQFTTLLATGDDETRVLVVGALSKMRHADLEALADLLDSPSEELRRTAIRALGHSGSTAAIPHLTPMLSDDRWQVRAATLDALEELVDDNRSKTQVGRAVSELLNDEDAFIRKRAIALIGEIEYTAARPELHAMLQAGNGDPKALLAALVALNDHRAAQQIRPRFESAQTTGEKQQWLTLLASAGEDAATDQLLAAILQDPEQRPLWATAVYAIDRRDQTSRHLTLIASLLLDQDQDVADAAYRAMRYEDDPPLPTGVLDRLAQHDDPERRRWALNLLYTQRSDRLGDKLAQALNDPDTAVVRLALTMLSAEAGEPMPGVSLPYRRDQNSSYTVDVNGVATQDSTANTAPPAWVAIARDQLDRDLDIAVPAAALLYHTAEWQEDPVPAVLRRGMSSEAHPQLSGVALWAVKNNPDPFEADLDLVALAQQPSSRDAAIQIMAASTTGRYLPHLKELAKDATLEDAALVRALVVSNDDDAIAEALRLYNVDPDSWEANQAIEALSHAPGRGPVRFATALLDANPRYPSYRLPDMILSLPDPSAAPLLLRVAESNDYWVEPERVMTRLMEINPQSAAELSRQMLMGDQTHQIDSAIAALVQTVPNDDAAALALRAMSQQTAAAAAATWDPLVEWLPKAFVRDALPADLANLNPTAGQAVMRRLARDASPEDLRALLAANWSDVRAREPLAQIVARLTADNPAARPKLDTLEPGALALMLSAAAEWPDALDTISPYLEHPDPRVAQAAVTGLALHAASAPPPDLTEAQQTALVRAAQSEEPRTAYLAVEALAQAQPSALQRLEPDSIQGPAARTRAALAGVDTDPGVFLGQLVNGAHGHTPLRFASLLALQQGEAPPAQLPSSYAFRYHHDLLTRHVAAQTHPNPDWVAALLEFHELPETFAGNAEVMSSLVEHARSTTDAELLSLLGRNGLVADPQPQDVVLLLDNLRKFLNRDRGGWETDPTSSLLIAWAEAADPQEMRSRMKANSAQGVTAAAILALGHQDSQAIDLLAALVTQPPTGRQLQRASTIHRRMLALDTLALLNHQAIVPSLVEQTRDADASDWHRSQYTDRLVLTIAALDPTSAAQLPATSRRSQYTGDLLLDASTVTLMLLDQTASPQTANAQPAIQRPPTPSPLLQGLEAERTPPLPDRAQREELLPPWPARTWNTEDAGSFHHWYEPEDGAAVAMPASTGAAGYYLDLGAPTQDKHHTETATTPSNDLLRARLLDPDIKPPARTSVLRAIASGGHTDLIPDLTRLLKAPA
ncbi:MAG: HEAT repeat domain-containing protein, partial [Planctomycetota bacterium]